MSLPQIVIDPDGDVLITVSHQPIRYEDDALSPQPHDTENSGYANSIETTKSSETQSIKHQIDHKPCANDSVETRFKVSMKHLTMASIRAKALFTGDQAKTRQQIDGLFHWNCEGISDPLAFEIVMNAIHGKTRKLPKSLTVATLAEVATIVNELDCHQVLWFPAKIWIDQLDGSLPKHVCLDLLRFILIAWVFEEADLFEMATQVAISESKGPLSSNELAIPTRIIDMINEAREGLLETLTTQLGSLLQRVSCQDACTYDCKSLILGTLTHEMLSAKCVFSQRSSSFEGLSLTAAASMIRRFQLPQLYRPYLSGPIRIFVRNVWVVKKSTTLPSDKSDSESQGEGAPPQICEGSGHRLAEHICGLRRLVISEMESLNVTVKGLELPDRHDLVKDTSKIVL